MENERVPIMREKTHNLTTSPGVYIMKNQSGKIIYIGKAKNLKNRVTSYFRETPDHTPKVAAMVSQVWDYDFIVTDSEYEALLLECSLIKLHKPKYNILLKDDKGYHYIKISGGAFPRLTAAVNQIADGSTYLGPYVSSFVTKKTVEETNTIFRLPTCSRSFPSEFGKGRPCLNYHIKRCIGLCRGFISSEEYGDILSQALSFIKSGGGEAADSIRDEMEQASEACDFERAAMLRDRLRAIERAADEQKIIDEDIKNSDVIAIAENNGLYCLSVLIYRNGRLVDKIAPVFDNDLDDANAADAILPQFYSARNDIPPILLMDRELSEPELLERLLTEKAGRRVSIRVPKRGHSLSLIGMSKSNAVEELSVRFGRTSKEVAALEQLASLLGLQAPPVYIEAYDISNLSSTSMVAGMVVFENGRALKRAYKKYSMKTVQIQNDYACMREVLERRFHHYLDKDENDEGFRRLPDLIFVDGGKGQVNAVLPVLRGLGINTPVFGIVKDGKHRTRAIASNGGEISVSGSQSAFMLITGIQDEMHRFAISYQKKKHKAETLESAFTSVPGIGEKRASRLAIAFKTRDSLKAASVDELMTAAGINRATAEQLYELIQNFQ